MDQRPLLVSVTEARHLLGLGRTKLYALLESGAVPSVKVGTRRLVPIESIENFVSASLEESDWGLSDHQAFRFDNAPESSTSHPLEEVEL